MENENLQRLAALTPPPRMSDGLELSAADMEALQQTSAAMTKSFSGIDENLLRSSLRSSQRETAKLSELVPTEQEKAQRMFAASGKTSPEEIADMLPSAELSARRFDPSEAIRHLSSPEETLLEAVVELLGSIDNRLADIQEKL